MEALADISSLKVVFFGAEVPVFRLVPPLIAGLVKHTPRVEILDNLQRAPGVVIVLNEELEIYMVQFF